jgi:hypothetical protein
MPRFFSVEKCVRRIFLSFYDLIVFEAASHVTAFWRKNDSFAI